MFDPILHLKHVNYEFNLGEKKRLKAVNDISFHVSRGEIFGIVGESGSGKSTLARCIMGILTPQSGEIYYEGIKTSDRKIFKANRKFLQTSRQMIFQDSASSLNRRMSISDIVTEPMVINHIKPAHADNYRDEAAFQLKYVGLDKSFLDKKPYELSGGERQRVAIARAVITEPKLLVADEPVSGLDSLTKTGILSLLLHLRKEHGFSIVLISHDLLMVESLCDRIGIMFKGKLIETGTKEEIFNNPIHPYTQSLITAVPIPDPGVERKRERVIFDRESFNENQKMVRVDGMHHVMQ